MRIAGISIPDTKRLPIALTAVYGIGRARALAILEGAHIPLSKRPPEITPEEEQKIRKAIESFRVEGELKREVGSHVKRLKDIKSYRGIRHLKSLPVHGQRTKTNSRTRRGNVRKTMGSGRRKLEKK